MRRSDVKDEFDQNSNSERRTKVDFAYIVLLGHGLRPVRGLGSLSIAGWFRGWQEVKYNAVHSFSSCSESSRSWRRSRSWPWQAALPSCGKSRMNAVPLLSQYICRSLKIRKSLSPSCRYVFLSCSRSVFSLYVHPFCLRNSLKPDNKERGLPYLSSWRGRQGSHSRAEALLREQGRQR